MLFNNKLSAIIKWCWTFRKKFNPNKSSLLFSGDKRRFWFIGYHINNNIRQYIYKFTASPCWIAQYCECHENDVQNSFFRHIMIWSWQIRSNMDKNIQFQLHIRLSYNKHLSYKASPPPALRPRRTGTYQVRLSS